MSNEFSVDDYQELEGIGFERVTPKAPEEEFFHSVYISGVDRENHIGTVEKAGKIQVRGVEYNLDSVNMIITTTKPVLVKARRSQDNKNEVIECFCFQEGAGPWTSTTGRICGTNSAERAAVDFCKDCRSQLIVTGIYCTKEGSPILSEDRKPVFIFLRGKGMKYNNISTYLSELYNMEVSPFLEEKDREFEKKNLNNKRVVTQITIGEVPSSFGPKKVFELKIGAELPKSVVFDVLKITKKTTESFREKFDLSRRKKNVGAAADTDDQKFQLPSDEEGTPEKQGENKGEEAKTQESAFDFQNLDF